MCIRINGDINDVAEMYLDNELRSIKSFLEEVLDLPGRPTINELLGAVKHQLFGRLRQATEPTHK